MKYNNVYKYCSYLNRFEDRIHAETVMYREKRSRMETQFKLLKCISVYPSPTYSARGRGSAERPVPCASVAAALRSSARAVGARHSLDNFVIMSSGCCQYHRRIEHGLDNFMFLDNNVINIYFCIHKRIINFVKLDRL